MNGWLQKQGKYLKSWKSRYYVVLFDHPTNNWILASTESKPKKDITNTNYKELCDEYFTISGSSVSIDTSNSAKAEKPQNVFSITPVGEKAHILLAESITERNMWLNAFAHCGALGWIPTDEDQHNHNIGVNPNKDHHNQHTFEDDDNADSFAFQSNINYKQLREQQEIQARSRRNTMRPAYGVTRKKFGTLSKEQIAALQQQQQQQQTQQQQTGPTQTLLTAQQMAQTLGSPANPQRSSGVEQPNNTLPSKNAFNLLSAPQFLQPGSVQNIASPLPSIMTSLHQIPPPSGPTTLPNPSTSNNQSAQHQLAMLDLPTSTSGLGQSFNLQGSSSSVGLTASQSTLTKDYSSMSGRQSGHLHLTVSNFNNNNNSTNSQQQQQPVRSTFLNPASPHNPLTNLYSSEYYHGDDDNERDVMVLEGWLEKKPPAFFKQYRKRWCQLFSLPPRMLYFQSRDEAYKFAEQQRNSKLENQQNADNAKQPPQIVPLGVMHLYGAQIKLNDDSGEFTLHLAWGQNPVLINTKNKQNRAEWIRALIPLVAVSPVFLKQVIELAQNPIVIADIEQRSKEAKKMLFDSDGEILPQVTMDMNTFVKQFQIIPPEVLYVCPLIVTALNSKIILQQQIGRLWALFIQQEQIHMHGDMYKQGKNGGQWKSRHCVLTSGVLLYFENSSAVKASEVTLNASALYQLDHALEGMPKHTSPDNFFQLYNQHGDTGTIGRMNAAGLSVIGPYGSAPVQERSGRDSLRLSGRIPGLHRGIFGGPAGSSSLNMPTCDEHSDDDQPVGIKPLPKDLKDEFDYKDMERDFNPGLSSHSIVMSIDGKDGKDSKDPKDTKGAKKSDKKDKKDKRDKKGEKKDKDPQAIVDETWQPIYNPTLSSQPHMDYSKIRALAMTTTWCWLECSEACLPLGFISLNNCKVTYLTKAITPPSNLPSLPRDIGHCVQITLGGKQIHNTSARTFFFALKYFYEVKPWLSALSLTTNIGFIRDEFNNGFWNRNQPIPSMFSHLFLPQSFNKLSTTSAANSRGPFPTPHSTTAAQTLSYEWYSQTTAVPGITFDTTRYIPHPIPFAFTPLSHRTLNRLTPYIRPALSDIQFVTLLQSSRFFQSVASEVLQLTNDGVIFYSDGQGVGGSFNGGFIRFPISSTLRLLPRRDIVQIESKLHDMLMKQQDRINFIERIRDLVYQPQSTIGYAQQQNQNNFKQQSGSSSDAQSAATGTQGNIKDQGRRSSITTTTLSSQTFNTKPSSQKLFQDEFPDVSYTPATLASTEGELFTLTDSLRDFLNTFSLSRSFLAYWAVQEEAYCDFAINALAHAQNSEIASISAKIVDFHITHASPIIPLSPPPSNLPSENHTPLAPSITQALSVSPITALVGFRYLLLWLQCEEFCNHIPGSLQQRYIAQRIYNTFLSPSATLPVNADLALIEEISLRLLDPQTFGGMGSSNIPRGTQQTLLHEDSVLRQTGVIHYNSLLSPDQSSLTYERTSPQWLWPILTQLTATKQILPSTLFRQLQQFLHEVIAVDVYPHYLTKDCAIPPQHLGGDDKYAKSHLPTSLPGGSVETGSTTLDIMSPRDSITSIASHVSFHAAQSPPIHLAAPITVNNNIHHPGNPTVVLPFLTDEILLRKLHHITEAPANTITAPSGSSSDLVYETSRLSSRAGSNSADERDPTAPSPPKSLQLPDLLQIQIEVQHRLNVAMRDAHTGARTRFSVHHGASSKILEELIMAIAYNVKSTIDQQADHNTKTYAPQFITPQCYTDDDTYESEHVYTSRMAELKAQRQHQYSPTFTSSLHDNSVIPASEFLDLKENSLNEPTLTAIPQNTSTDLPSLKSPSLTIDTSAPPTTTAQPTLNTSRSIFSRGMFGKKDKTIDRNFAAQVQEQIRAQNPAALPDEGRPSDAGVSFQQAFPDAPLQNASFAHHDDVTEASKITRDAGSITSPQPDNIAFPRSGSGTYLSAKQLPDSLRSRRPLQIDKSITLDETHNDTLNTKRPHKYQLPLHFLDPYNIGYEKSHFPTRTISPFFSEQYLSLPQVIPTFQVKQIVRDALDVLVRSSPALSLVLSQSMVPLAIQEQPALNDPKDKKKKDAPTPTILKPAEPPDTTAIPLPIAVSLSRSYTLLFPSIFYTQHMLINMAMFISDCFYFEQIKYNNAYSYPIFGWKHKDYRNFHNYLTTRFNHLHAALPLQYTGPRWIDAQYIYDTYLSHAAPLAFPLPPELKRRFRERFLNESIRIDGLMKRWLEYRSALANVQRQTAGHRLEELKVFGENALHAQEKNQYGFEFVYPEEALIRQARADAIAKHSEMIDKSAAVNSKELSEAIETSIASPTVATTSSSSAINASPVPVVPTKKSLFKNAPSIRYDIKQERLNKVNPKSIESPLLNSQHDPTSNTAGSEFTLVDHHGSDTDLLPANKRSTKLKSNRLIPQQHNPNSQLDSPTNVPIWLDSIDPAIFREIAHVVSQTLNTLLSFSDTAQQEAIKAAVDDAKQREKDSKSSGKNEVSQQSQSLIQAASGTILDEVKVLDIRQLKQQLFSPPVIDPFNTTPKTINGDLALGQGPSPTNSSTMAFGLDSQSNTSAIPLSSSDFNPKPHYDPSVSSSNAALGEFPLVSGYQLAQASLTIGIYLQLRFPQVLPNIKTTRGFHLQNDASAYDMLQQQQRQLLLTLHRLTAPVPGVDNSGAPSPLQSRPATPSNQSKLRPPPPPPQPPLPPFPISTETFRSAGLLNPISFPSQRDALTPNFNHKDLPVYPKPHLLSRASNTLQVQPMLEELFLSSNQSRGVAIFRQYLQGQVYLHTISRNEAISSHGYAYAGVEHQTKAQYNKYKHPSVSSITPNHSQLQQYYHYVVTKQNEQKKDPSKPASSIDTTAVLHHKVRPTHDFPPHHPQYEQQRTMTDLWIRFALNALLDQSRSKSRHHHHQQQQQQQQYHNGSIPRDGLTGRNQRRRSQVQFNIKDVPLTSTGPLPPPPPPPPIPPSTPAQSGAHPVFKPPGAAQPPPVPPPLPPTPTNHSQFNPVFPSSTPQPSNQSHQSHSSSRGSSTPPVDVRSAHLSHPFVHVDSFLGELDRSSAKPPQNVPASSSSSSSGSVIPPPPPSFGGSTTSLRPPPLPPNFTPVNTPTGSTKSTFSRPPPPPFPTSQQPTPSNSLPPNNNFAFSTNKQTANTANSSVNASFALSGLRQSGSNSDDDDEPLFGAARAKQQQQQQQQQQLQQQQSTQNDRGRSKQVTDDRSSKRDSSRSYSRPRAGSDSDSLFEELGLQNALEISSLSSVLEDDDDEDELSDDSDSSDNYLAQFRSVNTTAKTPKSTTGGATGLFDAVSVVSDTAYDIHYQQYLQHCYHHKKRGHLKDTQHQEIKYSHLSTNANIPVISSPIPFGVDTGFNDQDEISSNVSSIGHSSPHHNPSTPSASSINHVFNTGPAISALTINNAPAPQYNDVMSHSHITQSRCQSARTQSKMRTRKQLIQSLIHSHPFYATIMFPQLSTYSSVKAEKRTNWLPRPAGPKVHQIPSHFTDLSNDYLLANTTLNTNNSTVYRRAMLALDLYTALQVIPTISSMQHLIPYVRQLASRFGLFPYSVYYTQIQESRFGKYVFQPQLLNHQQDQLQALYDTIAIAPSHNNSERDQPSIATTATPSVSDSASVSIPKVPLEIPSASKPQPKQQDYQLPVIDRPFLTSSNKHLTLPTTCSCELQTKCQCVPIIPYYPLHIPFPTSNLISSESVLTPLPLPTSPLCASPELGSPVINCANVGNANLKRAKSASLAGTIGKSIAPIALFATTSTILPCFEPTPDAPDLLHILPPYILWRLISQIAAILGPDTINYPLARHNDCRVCSSNFIARQVIAPTSLDVSDSPFCDKHLDHIFTLPHVCIQDGFNMNYEAFAHYNVSFDPQLFVTTTVSVSDFDQMGIINRSVERKASAMPTAAKQSNSRSKVQALQITNYDDASDDDDQVLSLSMTRAQSSQIHITPSSPSNAQKNLPRPTSSMSTLKAADIELATEAYNPTTQSTRAKDPEFLQKEQQIALLQFTYIPTRPHISSVAHTQDRRVSPFVFFFYQSYLSTFLAPFFYECLSTPIGYLIRSILLRQRVVDQQLGRNRIHYELAPPSSLNWGKSHFVNTMIAHQIPDKYSTFIPFPCQTSQLYHVLRFIQPESLTSMVPHLGLATRVLTPVVKQRFASENLAFLADFYDIIWLPGGPTYRMLKLRRWFEHAITVNQGGAQANAPVNIPGVLNQQIESAYDGVDEMRVHNGLLFNVTAQLGYIAQGVLQVFADQEDQMFRSSIRVPSNLGPRPASMVTINSFSGLRAFDRTISSIPHSASLIEDGEEDDDGGDLFPNLPKLKTYGGGSSHTPDQSTSQLSQTSATSSHLGFLNIGNDIVNAALAGTLLAGLDNVPALIQQTSMILSTQQPYAGSGNTVSDLVKLAGNTKFSSSSAFPIPSSLPLPTSSGGRLSASANLLNDAQRRKPSIMCAPFAPAQPTGSGHFSSVAPPLQRSTTRGANNPQSEQSPTAAANGVNILQNPTVSLPSPTPIPTTSNSLPNPGTPFVPPTPVNSGSTRNPNVFQSTTPLYHHAYLHMEDYLTQYNLYSGVQQVFQLNLDHDGHHNTTSVASAVKWSLTRGLGLDDPAHFVYEFLNHFNNLNPESNYHSAPNGAHRQHAFFDRSLLTSVLAHYAAEEHHDHNTNEFDPLPSNQTRKQLLNTISTILRISPATTAVQVPISPQQTTMYVQQLVQLYPHLASFYAQSSNPHISQPILRSNVPSVAHSSQSGTNTTSYSAITPLEISTHQSTIARSVISAHSHHHSNNSHTHSSRDHTPTAYNIISLPLYALESIETSLKLKGFWLDSIVTLYCNVFSVIISLVNSDIFSTKEPFKMPYYRYYVETVFNKPIDLQSELLFGVGSGSQAKHPLSSIIQQKQQQDKDKEKSNTPASPSLPDDTVDMGALNQQQQAAMAAVLLTTNPKSSNSQVAQKYARPFGGISGSGLLATRHQVFGVKFTAAGGYQTL